MQKDELGSTLFAYDQSSSYCLFPAGRKAAHFDAVGK